MSDHVAWRLAARDTPLWARPNRRAGRYNHADEDATQYLALHPLTPWAELLRYAQITEPDGLAALRPPIWALRVRLERPPLRLHFDTAADHGLAPEDLVADDHAPCRRLASALRADPDGPRALIVPSAALPGTDNLVLLGSRIAVAYLTEPIDDRDVPTSVIAEDGRAPAALAAAVHHIGAAREHPALAAWREGRRLRFREPPIVA